MLNIERANDQRRTRYEGLSAGALARILVEGERPDDSIVLQVFALRTCNESRATVDLFDGLFTVDAEVPTVLVPPTLQPRAVIRVRRLTVHGQNLVAHRMETIASKCGCIIGAHPTRIGSTRVKNKLPRTLPT